MKDPQEELLIEPNSLGSDCCNFDVIEDDGVIKCVSCKEPCEEVFESIEQAEERLLEEDASRGTDLAEERFEEERFNNYYGHE